MSLQIQVGESYQSGVTIATVTRLTEHSVYYTIPEFLFETACDRRIFEAWVVEYCMGGVTI